MINCETFENLIEEYVDGAISNEQLAELKEHTKTCRTCREEFERCVLLQGTIRQAFSSSMSTEQAKASVMARLSAEPGSQARHEGYGPAWLAGRRAAIAAGILLAVGLLLGFVLGRRDTAQPTAVQLAARVPVRVTNLDGTVLVRHQDSDTWQTLTPDSSVHLGDTFHSAAKSAFVLRLENESTIEVHQNSMLVLDSYNGQTQFFLEHGQCKASLESPHGPFFISTPHGRVEALGTEFTVTVE